ncbi:MAG: AMP-binding protein, partial [Acidimicrobiaceae bacterium]|nr:AMP-binding protein [Acidimicrobiaceae bacterium]
MLDALRPAAVIGADGTSALAGGVPVEEGDALVVATSGTTGVPKGVVLTHAAVRASAVATSTRLGVDPDRHRWLSCLPLNHVGGLSVVCRALISGTRLDVLPGFDAAAVEERSGPDVLVSLVATALARLDAARFHTVVLGGS